MASESGSSQAERPCHPASPKPGEEVITKPGINDVLCGRGGGINNHDGNVKFRKMVNHHKLQYMAANRVDKPNVSREIVQLWRELDPPGRFLARTDGSRKGAGSVKAADTTWVDIGDKKAREKTSQCLRELSPDVVPLLREMQCQQAILTAHVRKMQSQQIIQERTPATIPFVREMHSQRAILTEYQRMIEMERQQAFLTAQQHQRVREMQSQQAILAAQNHRVSQAEQQITKMRTQVYSLYDGWGPLNQC